MDTGGAWFCSAGASTLTDHGRPEASPPQQALPARLLTSLGLGAERIGSFFALARVRGAVLAPRPPRTLTHGCGLGCAVCCKRPGGQTTKKPCGGGTGTKARAEQQWEKPRQPSGLFFAAHASAARSRRNCRQVFSSRQEQDAKLAGEVRQKQQENPVYRRVWRIRTSELSFCCSNCWGTDAPEHAHEEHRPVTPAGEETRFTGNAQHLSG